jgi:hypothetical protein
MSTQPHAYRLADWVGYLSHAEIDFLQSLARTLPAHPQLINIGAGAGTSALAFLEARPDLHLTTIDVQKDSSPFGCLDGELEAVRKAGLYDPARYHQIHGDSQSAGENWLLSDASPVHLVFIDGDHSYAGCKGDLLAWLQNLRDDGIVALHDYKKAPDNKPYPGVDLAVDELLVNNFRYAHLGTVDTLIAFRKKPWTEIAIERDRTNPTETTSAAGTNFAITPTTAKSARKKAAAPTTTRTTEIDLKKSER